VTGSTITGGSSISALCESVVESGGGVSEDFLAFSSLSLLIDRNLLLRGLDGTCDSGEEAELPLVRLLEPGVPTWPGSVSDLEFDRSRLVGFWRNLGNLDGGGEVEDGDGVCREFLLDMKRARGKPCQHHTSYGNDATHS